MSIEVFLEAELPRLQARGARVGLLTNQTAYAFSRQAYLFELLARGGVLRRVFIPEHGLFAELQDQVPLQSGQIYRELSSDDSLRGVDFVSLYQDVEESLVASRDVLEDLDVILINIQDGGSRYYTFATTASYLFESLKEHRLSPELLVIDRPNPAGRQVEGSILAENFASFVGRPGLPHRHGLTLGELARFFAADLKLELPLKIIRDPAAMERSLKSPATQLSTWHISPSPNMPGPFTPLVYSGQCLLEGTNLNEGRGTTRPFEIFGAPYLQFLHRLPASEWPRAHGAVLRALRYVPTFHKFGGQVCSGFQIHLTGEQYHSLAHSLRILSWVRKHAPEDFAWHSGVYEFRSDRPAIEILAGDKMLLDYLRGDSPDFGPVAGYLKSAEQAWIETAGEFLLYPVPLTRVACEAP